MMHNIPNILTLLRILVIPIIVIAFYFKDVVLSHRVAACIFLFAIITDFLDGYLARKFHWQSNFGKMFDPIADKVLVGCILIMIVKFRKIQEVPCLLILSREFIVAGMREFLAQLRVSVPVSRLSKVKTFMQMSAIFIILLGHTGSGIVYFNTVGHVLLWISAGLTIVTGYSYFYAFKRHISK